MGGSVYRLVSVEDIKKWQDRVIGHRLDLDKRYGAQGPDLVNAYLLMVFGIGTTMGNGNNKARHVVNAHGDKGWFYVHGNQGARVGDVGEMCTDTEWGQCFVVVGVRGDELDVLWQNPGPVAVHTIRADRVRGYARPPLVCR